MKTIKLILIPFAVFMCACAPLEGVDMVGPAGGFVFYDKGSYSDGWRYLEASPVDTKEAAKWGLYNQPFSGTSSDEGSGKQNTDLILTELETTGESGKAAQLCAEFSYGGYTDWFLPSKDELILMMETAKKLFKTRGEYWTSTLSSSRYTTPIVEYAVTVSVQYDDDPRVSYESVTSECKIRPARRF